MEETVSCSCTSFWPWINKNSSTLGSPKQSIHLLFHLPWDSFLYLRVFHISHNVSLITNLNPTWIYDWLTQKWQCVRKGSLDSFHFAGMGDSKHPVTQRPMVYKYKPLVLKRLCYKVKFLALIIIWLYSFFNRPVNRTNVVTDEIQIWFLPPAAQYSAGRIIFCSEFLPDRMYLNSYQTVLPGNIQFQVTSINTY